MGMIANTSTAGKANWKKIKQTARDQNISMLHFNRLNWNAYGYLYNKTHKAYRIGGTDALPKR